MRQYLDNTQPTKLAIINRIKTLFLLDLFSGPSLALVKRVQMHIQISERYALHSQVLGILDLKPPLVELLILINVLEQVLESAPILLKS